jgi:hypothetical protein
MLITTFFTQIAVNATVFLSKKCMPRPTLPFNLFRPDADSFR